MLDRNQTIEISMVVRSRMPRQKWLSRLRTLGKQFPHERTYLSSSALDRLRGARPADVQAVARFGVSNGLTLRTAEAGRRSVRFSGTLAAIEQMLGIEFIPTVRHAIPYRTYAGSIHLPKSIRPLVKAVLGLRSAPAFSRTVARFVVGQQGMAPRRVAEFYGFPRHSDGTGQCIAVIELGGGFHRSDLEAYCRLQRIPVPNVTVVELGGQKNSPAPHATIKSFLKREHGGQFQASDLVGLATIEASMDVQLVAALANRADIVVYFAPNTPAGKYRAWEAALHSRTHPATVISCSWSAHENSPTLLKSTIAAMEVLFERAAQQGVTVCVSAGDDGTKVVHYPASSPWVLGCGGTHLELRDNKFRETPWSEPFFNVVCETSGGASQIFRLPHWQRSVHPGRLLKKSGRAIPDVAAKANIRKGYTVIVGGQQLTMGGTSAAAPLWACLAARINQSLGTRLGFINPLLYAEEFAAATAVVRAGGQPTNSRWHLKTGLGSPRGTALHAVLRSLCQPGATPSSARG